MGWPVFDGIMDDEGVVVLLVVFEGGGVEVFVVNGVNVFGGGWGVLAEWAWGGGGGGGGGGNLEILVSLFHTAFLCNFSDLFSISPDKLSSNPWYK